MVITDFVAIGSVFANWPQLEYYPGAFGKGDGKYIRVADIQFTFDKDGKLLSVTPKKGAPIHAPKEEQAKLVP